LLKIDLDTPFPRWDWAARQRASRPAIGQRRRGPRSGRARARPALFAAHSAQVLRSKLIHSQRG